MSSDKIELSQRQWLNIIIISISVMFFLFVVLGNKINQAPISSNMSIKPYQISRIDFGEFEFSRDDQAWLDTNKQYSAQKIKSTLLNWQQLISQPGQSYSENSLGKTLLVYLEGQAAPLVIKLQIGTDEFHIYWPEQSRSYQFPKTLLAGYYPEKI